MAGRSGVATTPAAKKAAAAKKVTAATKSSAPQQPVVKSVASFAAFLSELDAIGYVKTKLWYRGIGDTAYSLTPSLFRHKTAKTQSALKKLELDLNETFEMRSLPYAESRDWAKDEWERLFFMQHYRVPTRLLDWSGSPLVSKWSW